MVQRAGPPAEDDRDCRGYGLAHRERPLERDAELQRSRGRRSDFIANCGTLREDEEAPVAGKRRRVFEQFPQGRNRTRGNEVGARAKGPTTGVLGALCVHPHLRQAECGDGPFKEGGPLPQRFDEVHLALRFHARDHEPRKAGATPDIHDNRAALVRPRDAEEFEALAVLAHHDVMAGHGREAASGALPGYEAGVFFEQWQPAVRLRKTREQLRKLRPIPAQQWHGPMVRTWPAFVNLPSTLRLYRLPEMTSPSLDTNLFIHADDAIDFPAGATIFRQGEPGAVMYAVQEGEVDLIVNGVTVETVGPRGMFGELALIDQGPRSSNAVARTECRLVGVDQARFMLMIRQTPFFAVQVLRLVAHRLRATDARLGG